MDEVVGLVSVVDGESGDVVAVAPAVARLCFSAQYVKILMFFDRGIIPLNGKRGKRHGKIP